MTQKPEASITLVEFDPGAPIFTVVILEQFSWFLFRKPEKATILNRRHVLTEVDCCKLIKKSSRQRSSNLFELAASDGRFRYDIRADQLQLQPNGDFCLIRLDSDILYSSMSKPVCYPKVGFHFGFRARSLIGYHVRPMKTSERLTRWLGHRVAGLCLQGQWDSIELITPLYRRVKVAKSEMEFVPRMVMHLKHAYLSNSPQQNNIIYII